jgi:hypothetical protein
LRAFARGSRLLMLENNVLSAIVGPPFKKPDEG